MERLLQNTDSMKSGILLASNKKNQLVVQAYTTKAIYIKLMCIWLISTFGHHEGQFFVSTDKQPIIFKWNLTQFNTCIMWRMIFVKISRKNQDFLNSEKKTEKMLRLLVNYRLKKQSQIKFLHLIHNFCGKISKKFEKYKKKKFQKYQKRPKNIK